MIKLFVATLSTIMYFLWDKSYGYLLGVKVVQKMFTLFYGISALNPGAGILSILTVAFDWLG